MSEISPLRPFHLSISCAGAFPVRTSAQPAREPAWLVRDPACFSKWPGSFASYDPESSSWRTFQRSLLGGWIPYSGRWPLSGMLRGGEVCEHQRWAHLIAERGGSVSLGWPTPTAQAAEHGAPTEWEKQSGRNGLWIAAAQAWPTPIATETKQPTNSLSRLVATGQRLCKGDKRRSGNGATGAAKAWPTASATDYKGSSKPGQRRGQLTEPIEPGSGGRLNPAWVEMLMGFPAGWTLTDGPHLQGHSTHGSHPAPDQDSPTTETD